MVEVIDDNFMICTDCALVIANGDYSGLDYHYGVAAGNRATQIDAAIDQIDGEVVPGNSENDEEFSSKPCECCKSLLSGYRHHFVILSH